jgi:5-methylcytosine-specific restriction protein A
MVKRYCHRCKAVVPKDHRHRAPDPRPSASQRGYDHRWHTTRTQFLNAFPICQWHEGCIEPATDVHHLDGKGPLGEQGHDFGNLQALCHAHHSQLTAADHPAGWNRR